MIKIHFTSTVPHMYLMSFFLGMVRQIAQFPEMKFSLGFYTTCPDNTNQYFDKTHFCLKMKYNA